MSAAGISPFGTETAARQLPQRVRPDRAAVSKRVPHLGQVTVVTVPPSKSWASQRCREDSCRLSALGVFADSLAHGSIDDEIAPLVGGNALDGERDRTRVDVRAEEASA